MRFLYIFLTSSLVRGLIGQAIGTAVGIGFVNAIRSLAGLESNPDKISQHEEVGRNVILGDATDSDFWERVKPGKIRLVLLTLPQLSANLDVIHRLVASPYDGVITAVARYPDEVEVLEQAGVHEAFDIFAEAGAGFASHVAERFAEQLSTVVDGNT